MTAQPIVLAIENLTVSFDGFRAVNELNLYVEKNELRVVIGPNGAGKTTLVNVLTGFQDVDQGEVRLAGADMKDWKPHERSRRGLVRTFQNVLPFAGLTALENVEAGAMAQGISRKAARAEAMEVLAAVGLADKAERRVNTLPFGEERRVGIARAIAMKPQFLLMDEPGAGLNDAESEDLKTVIQRIKSQHQCGVLLIEHRMSLVFGLSDRIQVLQHGATIAIGTPDEIRVDPRVRAAYLGDEKI